jgi:hypothetical protein
MLQTYVCIRDLKFSRQWLWRMPSSGMLRRVAVVRTDVLEEDSAFIIEVTIDELGTTLAVTSNWSTLLATANVVPSSPILVTMMMEAIRSSETSVITRVKLRNMPEDGILIIYACTFWWHLGLCLCPRDFAYLKMHFVLVPNCNAFSLKKRAKRRDCSQRASVAS